MYKVRFPNIRVLNGIVMNAVYQPQVCRVNIFICDLVISEVALESMLISTTGQDQSSGLDVFASITLSVIVERVPNIVVNFKTEIIITP